MAEPVNVPVDPITLADRLRKSAFDLTERNMHTEAFLMELASQMIAEMTKANQPIASRIAGQQTGNL
ncbi:hypothetical protein A9Q94_15745 [Rhodobacterales bacterium 56_14_T64]|nr:hypothetical protein A9Q94_15745 [Rhodobacterales bacterium 56_14_T64]